FPRWQSFRQPSCGDNSRLWSLDDIPGFGAMSEKISFVDTSGRPVSGHFEVNEGLITVTLSDGTKTTADIQHGDAGKDASAADASDQASRRHERRRAGGLGQRWKCLAV